VAPAARKPSQSLQDCAKTITRLIPRVAKAQPWAELANTFGVTLPIAFNLRAANDSLTSEFKYLSDIDATSPGQTLKRGVPNQNQVSVEVMDKLKTILTLVALILVALGVLVVIGFVYAAVFYLFIFGIICLATVIAMRFLVKPGSGKIDEPDPKRELRNVQSTLEEYKRKG
jgi:hypothetical protein